MSISRITAMVIQTNEVKCTSKGPYENGKFGMTILLIRDGEIHRGLVSVDYGYFNTAEEAKQTGENLVQEIRDLGNKIWEKVEE